MDTCIFSISAVQQRGTSADLAFTLALFPLLFRANRPAAPCSSAELAPYALRVAFADVPDVVPSPEDLVLDREADAERAADVVLDELRAATKPEFWTAFYAHVVEGLPVATIAKLEGVPSRTVYNRLRIARRDQRAASVRKRAQRRREGQRMPRPRDGAR